MKNLKSLNPLLLRYKWQLLLGAFFIVAANFVSVYMVRYIGEGVNIIEEAFQSFHTATEAEKSEFYTRIVKAGLLIIAFPVLTGILSYLKRQTIIVTSRHVEFDLKNNIFKQYQKLDLGFYKANRTGDLMNRISEDVGYVRQYLGPGIMYPIELLSLGILLIIEMWGIDKTLTLYTLAPLPVLSVLIYYISKEINKLSDEVQVQQSNLSSFVQDAFSGIRVIKSYNKELPVRTTYAGHAGVYKNKSVKLADTQAFFFPLMLIVIGISQILILFIGGSRFIEGKITEVGTLAQFIVYLNMLIWPFTSLGWVSMIVQRAEASMKRINQFLKEIPDIQNMNPAEQVIKGDITFKNVRFVYENSGIEALRDVSFHLPARKTMAILGKTGSGKSTIAQLIARLYDPTSGAVLMDGIPLPQMNLYALRRQIGFVPQEAFLFSDTLANNIAFALDDFTAEEVERFAESADVHSNIMGFKEKYETKIGERGITLSGGQKQRISIARALIKDPPVLIFDDSLSAVDTETEERILKNIQQASSQKTTLIITHRISAAKLADIILFLKDGKVAETGTHAQLMQQNGLYKDLYEKQLADEVSGFS